MSKKAKLGDLEKRVGRSVLLDSEQVVKRDESGMA